MTAIAATAAKTLPGSETLQGQTATPPLTGSTPAQKSPAPTPPSASPEAQAFAATTRADGSSQAAQRLNGLTAQGKGTLPGTLEIDVRARHEIQFHKAERQRLLADWPTHATDEIFAAITAGPDPRRKTFEITYLADKAPAQWTWAEIDAVLEQHVAKIKTRDGGSSYGDEYDLPSILAEPQPHGLWSKMLDAVASKRGQDDAFPVARTLFRMQQVLESQIDGTACTHIRDEIRPKLYAALEGRDDVYSAELGRFLVVDLRKNIWSEGVQVWTLRRDIIAAVVAGRRDDFIVPTLKELVTWKGEGARAVPGILHYSDHPQLFRLLKEPALAGERWAEELLGAGAVKGDRGCMDLVTERLASQGETKDPDTLLWSVFRTAIDRKVSNPATRAVAAALLDHPSFETRRSGAKMVAADPSDEALALARQHLDDPDAKVRAALEQIIEARKPKAPPPEKKSEPETLVSPPAKKGWFRSLFG